jgi:7-carboxy-7-deazaguanine synthase (Cx14CxxC type)
MAYRIKEIFYTLQGEGTQTGRPAVFCRFAGCNLWTGRESARTNAICQFCDTDFVGINGPGGGRFGTADELAESVASAWRGLPHCRAEPYVVCTGGEPLLQLDEAAVAALHRAGLVVAIETNGTRSIPPGVDWVCVSPKGGAEMVVPNGDELKLVFPQELAPPEAFERLDFGRWFIQPMDGVDCDKNTRLAIEYCLTHPQWHLSIQSHKYLAIP